MESFYFYPLMYFLVIFIITYFCLPWYLSECLEFAGKLWCFFFATNAMEHVGTECMGSVTECMIPGMGARYFMECFGGFGSFENFNDF